MQVLILCLDMALEYGPLRMLARQNEACVDMELRSELSPATQSTDHAHFSEYTVHCTLYIHSHCSIVS